MAVYLLPTSLLSAVLLAAMPAAAMQMLDDQEMAAVSGAGIAIAFDDFQFAMAPTSYIEQVGSAPDNVCSSASGVGNQHCWRRGDLRWYGGTISGVNSNGSHWNEVSCDANSLACPRGGDIEHFAPFDNPYVMRAWSPAGMGFDGSCINGTDDLCQGPSVSKSIYEFVAPSQQPDYLFSFWGEIESGRVPDPAAPWDQQLGDRFGLLKSQTLIRGNAAGSVFRAFQFTDPANRTLGLLYHSRLQGDFRFSVARDSSGTTDVVGEVPVFDGQEGLHFRNVDAYIPLGQLYYQALIIGAAGNQGGFYMALPMIPDVAPVYQRHYGLQADDIQGYDTARLALQGTASEDYLRSHGHARWGDWHPGSGGSPNNHDATDSGIFFRACSGCDPFPVFAKRPVRIDVRGETQSMYLTQNYADTLEGGPGPVSSGAGNNQQHLSTVANLGDARAEGILINAFQLTSCSAGPDIC